MSLQDDIFDQVPQWDQARVRAARVLVVGAGALGNEVLKNLALLNVQQLVIMDFDQVESSNLTRSILFRQADADAGRYKAEVAAERLLEINPDLKIHTLLGDVVTDLSLGLLAQVDVVIGCVDNRLARLYLNRLCWRAGKPWVDGGILNLAGQVAAYVPGHSCYECGITPTGWQEIRTRLGCTDMARRYALDGHAPTTPIAASIIGALQVQEALKLVLGLRSQSLAGKLYSFEGAHMLGAVYESKPLLTVCESHFEAVQSIAAPLSCTSTLGALFHYLRTTQAMQAPELLLDHSLATSLAGLQTGHATRVILPVHHFSDQLARSLAPHEALGIPKGAMIEALRPGDLSDQLPLWALGIPAGHVLRVGRGEARRWVQLADDNRELEFAKGIHGLQNRWWQPTAERVRMLAQL
jgi:molybdopterin/thiamine biosynthesis adenylyltransferase